MAAIIDLKIPEEEIQEASVSLADAKVASVTLSDLGDIFASTALLGAHPVVPLPLIGFGETLAKHGGASSQLMTPVTPL